jgi:Cu/Ag efflux protein CusF
MRAIVTTAFLGYMALTGSALAVPENATGTITAIDSGKHQITLSDGQTYAIPDNIKSEGFKVGDKVAVIVEKQDGANIVQSISRG